MCTCKQIMWIRYLSLDIIKRRIFSRYCIIKVIHKTFFSKGAFESILRTNTLEITLSQSRHGLAYTFSSDELSRYIKIYYSLKTKFHELDFYQF